jgi:hypothetical protein
MNLADALKSLKEFFLEFLGYFLPGFTFIFLLGLVLADDIVDTIFQKRVLQIVDNTYVLVFISYLFGYVIYGADLSRKVVFNFISRQIPKQSRQIKKLLGMKSRKDMETIISSSFEYETTKAIINNKFGNLEVDLGFSGYRNYAMSTISSDDIQKIYTFIFRGELCKHIGLIFFSTGLVCIAIKLCGFQTIKVSTLYTILYVGLMMSGYFLQRSAERFTLIGLKIGFSIFLSNQYFKK